ncbi:MAG: tetratricopeptide repeat protein [Candidatus Hydrogenedentes bacterium]|nr:tetratricopeptide repeat protein [Candidatus Hydrogenedentota bacterium]
MKRIWIYVIIAHVVLLAAAGAALAGYFVYSERKAQNNLAAAESLYRDGRWFEAARTYGLYLQKKQHRGDVAILLKYADACMKVRDNRPKTQHDAVIAYAQILQYQPDNTEIQDKLLDTLERLQLWPDLEYYAKDILDRHPDDAKAKYASARAKDGMQRQDEAIAAYRALIEEGAPNMSVYGNVARLLRERGLQQQALQTLDDAVKKYPDSARVQLERAKYFRLAGDSAGAEGALNKALELAPEDPDILLEAGEFAAKKREWGRAQVLADKALERAPDNAGAYIVASVVYQGKNQLDKAIEVLTSAPAPVLLDSQSLYFATIETLITGNKLDEARKYLDQYKRAYPESGHIAEYFESRELLVSGDSSGAAARLATLVQQRPDFGSARFLLGVAYLRSGQADKGRATLEAYVKTFPGDERARSLLEMDSQQKRSPEEAQKHARALLANESAQPEDLVTAARVLFEASIQQGKPEKNLDLVKESLEKAIVKSPSLGLSYKTLADVLVAVHDPAGAKAVIERGIAAGINEEQFYLNRAAVLLEERNLDGAKAQFAQVLAKGQVTADEIQGWARFMAVRGHADVAVEMLSQGSEKVEGPQRITLLTEKILMLARSGDMGGALQLLNDLESKPETAQVAAQPLLSAKLSVAQQLLEQNTPEQRETAKRLIDDVAKTDPNNSNALALQAQILLQQQPPALDAAQELLEKAISGDVANVNALLWLAEIESRKNETDKAIAHVKRAAEEAPMQLGAQLRLARLQGILKLHADAQRTLEQTLERNPDSVDAMRMLMVSYFESGQIQQAGKLLPRLEEKAAQDSQLADLVKTLRGRLMVAKGAGEEAEAILREQAEKNPDDLGVLRDLARAMDQQGRTSDAEELLTSYVQKHSDSTQGWLTLAEFYLTRKDDATLKHAAQALMRVLLIDPENATVLRDMIQINVRRNNPIEVMALCNRYLATHPEDPDVLYARASIQAQSPATLAKALESINQALALRKESEFVALRGLVLIGLGQYQQAIDDLQPLANSEKESSAQLEAGLAEAYLGLKNVKMARDHYEIARKKADAGERVDKSRLLRIEQGLSKEAGAS